MNATVQTVTMLPAAMQRKKETMMSLDTKPTPTAEELAAQQAAQGVAAPTAEELAAQQSKQGGVTLTQEAYNEMQAAAGRLARANDQLAEMATRLTELEAAAKGAPKVDAAPIPPVQDLRVEATGTEFTEEEKKDFGDSEAFIAKVVRKQLAEQLNPLFDRVNAALSAIQTEAKAATSAAGNVQKNTFLTALQGKVPLLPIIIGHKHWQDFIDTQEPITGERYSSLLTLAVQNQRVEQAANIYRKFAEQYKVGVAAVDDGGFSGAAPSGGATVIPPDPGTVVKLKGSDRRKAGEDYRKGHITWDKLQEVTAKFAAADAQGNVDWDK